MAIITRRISNNLSYQFTIPCPGENNNQNANLIIPASVVDLDLLTLTTEDNLWTLQPQLLSLVNVGAITVTGTMDTATFDYNGVSSLHADSNPDISGDVRLVSGTGITLSQSGQNITVTSTGGGSGITQLTSDVTAGPGSGSQASTVVSVGGSSASNVHSAELAANAATSADTVSTIVKRDASGNFAAGTITVTAVTIDNPSSATTLKLIGDSTLGSSDTEGIKQYLIYNATGNRQMGFTDSSYPSDNVSPVIRFIFDSSGEPKIEACSTDTSVGIRLSIGNIAGVDINGTTGISGGANDYSNIGEGVNPTSPVAKLVVFGMVPTGPVMDIVANPTSVGGQSADLLDFYDQDVNLVASFSSTGALSVAGAITEHKAAILNVSVLATTGTVTPDGTLGPTFTMAVTGNVTLEGPSSPVNGQKVVFVILNDASHSVTFATGSGNFRFGTDIPSYTNSVSKTDYIGAIWNGGATRWDIVSVIQGF